MASENDMVYGDSYKITADGVEGIGNNVTLVFRHMDFGTAGAGRVALCWRTKLHKNAIQFVFAGENGEIRRMVDVGQAGDYSERIFPLGGRITGNNTVSLVFLPGCHLDLKSIQFLD